MKTTRRVSSNAPTPGHRGPRNVKQLLAEYNHLGVPHFQRGLVWDTDSVALLLESIYYGTPCGSIILWKPSNIAAHGIPLGHTAPRFLIIDGQQRIRSLHAVFAGNDSASATALGDLGDEGDDGVEASDEGADEQEQGIWCLNLGRLPETKDHFRGAKHRLFRRAVDPRRPSPTSGSEAAAEDPELQALVPLRWFLNLLDTQTEAEIRRRIEGTDRAVEKAVTAVLENGTVLKHLREMMTRPLFDLTFLEPDRSSSELRDVVGVYVRINSAGQRVEAEERAFANVVGEYQGASTALKTFFDSTHGSEPTRDSKALSRDDLLRRQKENRFGFKLFMRTFVIVLAYHSDRKIGSSGFSFEMANAESLAKAGGQLSSLLDDTGSILKGLAAILRNPPLFCDDFRMLSETASLWPLVHLLARFPALMPNHSDLLAPIALRLLLADLSKPELLKLSDRVVRATTSTAALALFSSTSSLSSRSIRKAINRGVGRRSLTNRYTLMLYWLLRSRGARDFLYAPNLPDGGAAIRSRYGIEHEAELAERVQPQKQHIVPYARLKDMFQLAGARPGRHEVHDIGNLTYISAALNDLTGLSSRPLQLQDEPLENREAHMLKKAFLPAYRRACDGDLKTAKVSYAAFCSSRRRLIVEELIQWEQAASAAGGAPAPDLTPLTRRIKQRPDDVTRNLGYSPGVAALLGELSTQHSLERGRSKDARWSIIRKLKAGPRNYRQVWRIELWAGGQMMRLKLDDDQLVTGFKNRFPTIPLHSRKGNNPTQAQTVAAGAKKKRKCDLTRDDEMVKVLRWISDQT